MADERTAPFRLSCHCGDLRLEVDAALAGLTECNCSTCGRSGFLHWKVPAASVSLLDKKRSLSTYVWRAVHEGHHFCRICGTAILRTGYPGDRVSVNARCIDDVDIFALEISRFDGRTIMPPGPTH